MSADKQKETDEGIESMQSQPSDEPVDIDTLLDNVASSPELSEEYDSYRAIISVMHSRLPLGAWADCVSQLSEVVSQAQEWADRANKSNE